MNSTTSVVTTGETDSARGIGPYLAVFLGWWLLASLTLAVRIVAPLWHFVVELFWWQALLVEKIFGPMPRTATCALWLVLYLALAAACWWIVDARRRLSTGHVWRRAMLSSVLVQVLLLGIAMLVAPE